MGPLPNLSSLGPLLTLQSRPFTPLLPLPPPLLPLPPAPLLPLALPLPPLPEGRVHPAGGRLPQVRQVRDVHRGQVRREPLHRRLWFIRCVGKTLRLKDSYFQENYLILQEIPGRLKTPFLCSCSWPAHTSVAAAGRLHSSAAPAGEGGEGGEGEELEEIEELHCSTVHLYHLYSSQVRHRALQRLHCPGGRSVGSFGVRHVTSYQTISDHFRQCQLTCQTN